MSDQIAYFLRHEALKGYIQELAAKRNADRTNRTNLDEELAARAALLRLEREAGR